jgi:hypothetical protein
VLSTPGRGTTIMFSVPAQGDGAGADAAAEEAIAQQQRAWADAG